MKRPLVLLALAVLTLASCARNSDYVADVRDAPAPPYVQFRGEPTFVLVPGTNTYWSDNTTADLDLYRFGDVYYLMSSDYWYRAPVYDGPYTVIEHRQVPVQVVSAVDYRSRYGDASLRASRVRERDRPWSNPNRGIMTVNFQDRPRFRPVTGTAVFVAVNVPGDYDLFRHQGNYYVHEEGTVWYRNDTARGSYERIAVRMVPRPVLTVASRMARGELRRY